MTYSDFVEIFDAVCDEYAPKLKAATRTKMAQAVLTELEQLNELEVVEKPSDDEFESEEDNIED